MAYRTREQSRAIEVVAQLTPEQRKAIKAIALSASKYIEGLEAIVETVADRCEECGGEMTCCGDQDDDGCVTMDCQVCLLVFTLNQTRGQLEMATERIAKLEAMSPSAYGYIKELEAIVKAAQAVDVANEAMSDNSYNQMDVNGYKAKSLRGIRFDALYVLHEALLKGKQP